MAGAKTQTTITISSPSPWPILGAFSALIAGRRRDRLDAQDAVGPVGVRPSALLGVLATLFFWWSDVVHEANTGDHTPVVQLHHRYGMILFIASEVMFFVAWFWAYFSCVAVPERGGERSAASGRPRASRSSIRSPSRCSTP